MKRTRSLLGFVAGLLLVVGYACADAPQTTRGYEHYVTAHVQEERATPVLTSADLGNIDLQQMASVDPLAYLERVPINGQPANSLPGLSSDLAQQAPPPHEQRTCSSLNSETYMTLYHHTPDIGVGAGIVGSGLRRHAAPEPIPITLG